MLETIWNLISWTIWYALVMSLGYVVIDMVKHPHDWFD